MCVYIGDLGISHMGIGIMAMGMYIGIMIMLNMEKSGYGK